MAKKKIKSKEDSEESSSYSKDEEKTNKGKHRCPKCGLQFLYLSRHKKCKYVQKAQTTPTTIPIMLIFFLLFIYSPNLTIDRYSVSQHNI